MKRNGTKATLTARDLFVLLLSALCRICFAHFSSSCSYRRRLLSHFTGPHANDSFPAAFAASGYVPGTLFLLSFGSLSVVSQMMLSRLARRFGESLALR